MELVKNYLKSNSSSSVTVMCSKLEIPFDNIFSILESALNDLGQSNYRLIYALNTGNKVITFTEKHKKALEDQHNRKAKISAIQRVTEDIKNLYNSELHHREQLISEEIKNGGLFLPRFSSSGGFSQERREYNNQKKLNFRPKKVVPESKNKEIKEKVEDVKEKDFELEEEGIIRCPVEPAVMPFKRIIDIEIDDLDDIMTSEIPEVSIVQEVKRVTVKESSEEEETFEKNKSEVKVIEQPKIFPKKRKKKFNESLEKKVLRESIIPITGIKNNKMIQPSLGAFFKNK
jgi:hypothetical protein